MSSTDLGQSRDTCRGCVERRSAGAWGPWESPQVWWWKQQHRDGRYKGRDACHRNLKVTGVTAQRRLSLRFLHQIPKKFTQGREG